MAVNQKSVKYAAPQVMNVDGRAVYICDKVVNPPMVINDTYDWKIPAGLEVASIEVQADDVESTTTSTFKLGYTPVDSSSALPPNLAYFAATGQTLLRTGGRLVCPFKPIKFEEDVILRMTIEVAGTPIAGEIFAIIGGNAVGPK